MIRKHVIGGMVLLLNIGLLTGCQESPEGVMVTPKAQNENSYEEASSAPEEKIGELLGIPETYSLSLKSVDGKTYFTADHADIEYPDVNNIPVYEVGMQEFDQDFVNQITEALFGDAPVYFKLDYETHTKSEIMEEINFMKESVAKGDLNPYNEGKPDSFDIYEYIEELEAEYDQAPEEYTHKAVTPSIDFDPKENGYEISSDWEEYYQNSFDGYAVTDDGRIYTYELDEDEADRRIKAVRYRQKGLKNEEVIWSSCYIKLLADPEGEWLNWKLSYYNIEEKNLEKEAGISQEEAEKEADMLVEKLGIEGLERNCWNPALLTTGSSDEVKSVGYEFIYTRNIDGISTTYTVEECTCSLSDSTMQAEQYEKIIVIISKEGIESVEIVNPYKIKTVRQENPTLLPYEDIVKKFEDMLLVQHTKSPESEEGDFEYYVLVDKAILSYTRITEAKTGTYLLVPVWDFIGRRWDTSYSSTVLGSDGEVEKYCGSWMYPEPLVTINAMDGTIVDRAYGY